MNISRRFFILNTLTVLISIAVTALAAVVFTAAYTSMFGRDAGALEMKRVFEIRTGFGEIKRQAILSIWQTELTA